MAKKIVSTLIKSPIFKNLSILVSGTFIAQLIVIGFQIILRRLYSPADFGAFAVYMSIVGIVATISSFRYEQAILLPKENTHGIHVFKLSLLLIIFTFIVALISFMLFDESIIALVNFPREYSNWLYFIPVSIFLFSISQALNFYLIRDKRFLLSGSNKVLRRSFEGMVQAIFGYFTKAFGLFAGDLLGQFMVIIRSGIKIKSALRVPVSASDIKDVAKRYKDFPLKNGLSSLMNAMSLLLPIIIINRKFAPEITGYFDLARMVLILPLALITASLSQVLLQQFTEKRNNRQSIKKQAWGTIISLAIFALLFGVVIQFFGVQLFQWVFGSQWESSGVYASILVWAFALKFVVSPFNIVFTAFEKIGILSIWQTFYFALILLLAWLPFKSIEDFLWVYVLIELLSYGFAGILDARLIFNYEKSLNSLGE